MTTSTVCCLLVEGAAVAPRHCARQTGETGRLILTNCSTRLTSGRRPATVERPHEPTRDCASPSLPLAATRALRGLRGRRRRRGRGSRHRRASPQSPPAARSCSPRTSTPRRHGSGARSLPSTPRDAASRGSPSATRTTACDTIEAAVARGRPRADSRDAARGRQRRRRLRRAATRWRCSISTSRARCRRVFVAAVQGVTGVDWTPAARLRAITATGTGNLDDLFLTDGKGTTNDASIFRNVTSTPTSGGTAARACAPTATRPSFERIADGSPSAIFFTSVGLPPRSPPGRPGGELPARHAVSRRVGCRSRLLARRQLDRVPPADGGHRRRQRPMGHHDGGRRRERPAHHSLGSGVPRRSRLGRTGHRVPGGRRRGHGVARRRRPATDEPLGDAHGAGQAGRYQTRDGSRLRRSEASLRRWRWRSQAHPYAAGTRVALHLPFSLPPHYGRSPGASPSRSSGAAAARGPVRAGAGAPPRSTAVFRYQLKNGEGYAQDFAIDTEASVSPWAGSDAAATTLARTVCLQGGWLGLRALGRRCAQPRQRTGGAARFRRPGKRRARRQPATSFSASWRSGRRFPTRRPRRSRTRPTSKTSAASCAPTCRSAPPSARRRAQSWRGPAQRIRGCNAGSRAIRRCCAWRRGPRARSHRRRRSKCSRQRPLGPVRLRQSCDP